MADFSGKKNTTKPMMSARSAGPANALFFYFINFFWPFFVKQLLQLFLNFTRHHLNTHINLEHKEDNKMLND